MKDIVDRLRIMAEDIDSDLDWCDEAANEIERLRAELSRKNELLLSMTKQSEKDDEEIASLQDELAICRDAIEVAYNVVKDWPERLDSDSDMATYRTTLRRLNEAVGKAVPRLLMERPEGQVMYGLYYREMRQRINYAEALLKQALNALEENDSRSSLVEALRKYIYEQ